MSDPMEYLNQAKANLAAMQQAVAVQAQQEQMAMLLRERMSQIDQMVAEPAEPVGSTTSYLSEEDRRRFGLDPGGPSASTASRGRQPAMQPAMAQPAGRMSGAAPAYPDRVPGPSAGYTPLAPPTGAASRPLVQQAMTRPMRPPPAGMDSGTAALIRKLEECGEYENADKLRRSFS
jgi:hypothetical protein